MVGSYEMGGELLELLESKGLKKTKRLIENLLKTESLNRLKDISYLASIPYAFPNIQDFSRWDHSIGTAHLLAKVLIENEFSEGEILLVVTAGLLHDIGNVPFSHIGEVVIKEKHNLDQVKLRERIIESSEIYTLLNKFDIKSYEIHNAFHKYSELLDSHFDCDTLDGISRTARAIGWEPIDWMTLLPTLLRYEERKWKWSEDAVGYLKKQWELKGKIYSEYVHSPKNQTCEAMIEHLLWLIDNDKILLTESEIFVIAREQPSTAEILSGLETGRFYSRIDNPELCENNDRFQMLRKAILNSDDLRDGIFLRMQTKKVFGFWEPSEELNQGWKLDNELRSCYSVVSSKEAYVSTLKNDTILSKAEEVFRIFKNRTEVPIRFISPFEETGSKTYPVGVLVLATILQNDFFSDMTYHEYVFQYCDKNDPSTAFSLWGIHPSDPWKVEYSIFDNFDSYEKLFREVGPTPMILIGPVFTCYLQELMFLASKIRELRSDAIIIAGGPHFGLSEMMDSQLMARCDALDGLIIGEAEDTLLEVMEIRTMSATKSEFFERLENSAIRGLLTRTGNFEKREEISNLDDVPIIDLDLLHSSSPFFCYYLSDRRNPYLMTSMGYIEDAYGGGATMDDMFLFIDPFHSPGYREQQDGEKYTPNFGFGIVNGSRGCPFNCSFCASHGTRRLRSAEHIFQEMHQVYELFGIDVFVFFDPLFMTSNPSEVERIETLCDLLISSGLHKSIKFQIEIRADVILRLSDAFLAKLMESGCRVVNLGLEKGSDCALSRIDKKMKIRDQRDAIQKLRNVGGSDLLINGTFIIGGPDETLGDIKDTIIHAFALDLDGLAIFPLEIHPKTKDYEVALERGVIVEGLEPYLKLKRYPLFYSESVSKRVMVELSSLLDDVFEYLKQCRGEVNTLGNELGFVLPRISEIIQIEGTEGNYRVLLTDKYARWFQKLLKKNLAMNWSKMSNFDDISSLPEVDSEIGLLEKQLNQYQKPDHEYHTGDYSNGNLSHYCSDLLQSFKLVVEYIKHHQELTED